jgi:hypothetical protein
VLHTRAEAQKRTGFARRHRSTVLAADAAREVVQVYWKWYDHVNRHMSLQTEELERIKSSADAAYERFCAVANYAIRGRTF